MTSNVSMCTVRQLMAEFAYLTGLTLEKKPRRYLWTDAFAVCNFLELYRRTNEEEYKRLALRLVDQVHHVLGRHRKDNRRTGWISGLDEREGEKHPTIRGLRIGKELHEREPGEPLDWSLEWERDGQYYHYLTKWMHALNRVSRVTGDLTYNRWAMELAKTAHAAFTYEISPGQKRMYWKMSIDLSRPLVPSMGQHDPLDGLIVYNELQATSPEDPGWPDLNAEISDMARICEGKDWTTDDPLGIGELLCNAYKVVQLTLSGHFELTDFLPILLWSSRVGLEAYLEGKPFELPADQRLAFRELGLSIGLRAVERLDGLIAEEPDIFKGRALRLRIDSLLKHVSLADEIEGFWLERANRETRMWKEHRDINMVMLATSLAPDGYLGF